METVPQNLQTKQQHAVPQHVLGVEFKLVGEMTLRQFLFVAAGVVSGLLIFNSPLPQLIRIPLAAIPFFTGLAIAFLPIQGRNLDIWLVNFIRAIYSPTQWGWGKEGEPPEFLAQEPTLTSPSRQEQSAPPVGTTGGVPSRTQLKAYLEQVRTTRKASPNELDEQEEQRLQELPLLEESLPTTPAPDQGTDLPIKPPAFDKAGVPAQTGIPAQPTPAMQPTPKDNRRNKGLDPHLERRVQRLTQKLDRLYQRSRQTGTSQPPAGIEYYKRQLTELEQENQALQQELQHQKELGAMTHQLAGVQREYQLRIEELQKQLAERESQSAQTAAQPESSQPQLGKSLALDKIGAATKTDTPLAETPPPAILPPEGGVPMGIGAASNGASQPPPATQPAPALAAVGAPAASEGTPAKEDQPEPEKIAPFAPQIPNIISGIVKNQTGKFVEGAIVIIKDQDGDPIRALKTNSLGQFAITTTVPNSTYTVSVRAPTPMAVGAPAASDAAPGMTFDIIEIEAQGKVIEPLLFKAK